MFYKDFRGARISMLGLGVMRLPTEENDSHRIRRAEGNKIIDAAMECGINYYDTAYIYNGGDSECFIGESLTRYPRDSYYLTSKYTCMRGIPVKDMFEEQLRRCRTDYFDFYLFHGLEKENYAMYTDPEKRNLEYLLEQKNAGRIRWLGFSSHADPGTLSRFLDWYSEFDMAMIQLNYLDWTVLDAKTQYEILTGHGLPVWVMEPMKGGRLASLNPAARDILSRAAPESTPAEWGFRWLQSLPNVQTVLSGMGSIEMIRANSRIFSDPHPLSAGERVTLQRASDAYFGELGVPCSGCRYCCDTCPADLNIPLLIQAYNERRVSGYTWKVQGLEEAKGPEECMKCGACRTMCPQKINIPEVLAKYAELKKQAEED